MVIKRLSRAKKSLSNISKTPRKSPSTRIKTQMKTPLTRIKTPMKSHLTRIKTPKKTTSTRVTTPMKTPSTRITTPMKTPSTRIRTPIKRSSKRSNVSKKLEDSGADEYSGSDNEDSGSNENSGSENEGRLNKKKIRWAKRSLDKAKETPSKRSKSASDQKTKTPIKEIKKNKKETASPAKKSKTAAKKTAKPKAKVVKKMSRELGNDSENSKKTIRKSKRATRNKKYIDDENNEVKLIECKICKKEFRLYSALKRHEKVHIALAYACPLCKERCKSRPAYSYHMNREHPNVKVFPCVFPNCEESFTTQKKRGDHEKFHLKYTCQFCKQGFKQSHLMRFHVQNVHY